MTTHIDEISRGERFQFGENWNAFLSTLNNERIYNAEDSLKKMLSLDSLKEKKFLDMGSGSGLFSLAAKRLGAEVYSFDYDPKSVECTKEIKRRYYPNDNDWTIEEGSVLDETYLESLDKFDIVYSWGVLHHTGNMDRALNNAIIPLTKGGLLYITIYNDQGIMSSAWKKIKQTYCSNYFWKTVISLVFIPIFVLRAVCVGLIKYGNPVKYFVDYKEKRGMSIYYDWRDWLGGYPFEVASPEKIFKLYKNAGFRLENITTTNRLGCNQFVFKKL